MKPRRSAPPALAAWLLGHLLPEGERESFLGDLEESYRIAILPSRGRRAAARWYWGEAIRALLARRPGRAVDPNAPRGRPLTGTGSDLRYAVRQLVRSPLFAAISIALLSVGIGVNAALVSVIDTRLAHPVAGVPSIDGLVELELQRIRGANRPWTTFEEFLELRDRQRAFDHLAAVALTTFGETPIVDLGDATLEVAAVFVSGDYFAVMRPRMALGSPLPVVDDRRAVADPVAVVSYPFWRARLGSDSAVIGRTVRVNRVPVTIVGVLPRGFEPGRVPHTVELWLPLAMRPLIQSPPDRTGVTWPGRLPVESVVDGMTGRLRPGVSVEQATAALGAIAAGIGGRFRPEMPLTGVALHPLGDLSDSELWSGSAIIGNVTLLILLTACANVSILLLGRAVIRRREVAVRLALGARRSRVVRLLVVESVLLALLAGSAGILVAHWICEFFNARFPGMGTDYALSWRSVSVTLAFAAATGIAFGLVPALHATRASVGDALKSGFSATERHSSRLQHSFVVAEVALSMALVCAAWLLVGAFRGAAYEQQAYAASDRVLIADIQFSRSQGGVMFTEQRADALLSEMRARIARRPGVETVSFSSGHPLGIRNGNFVVVDSPERTASHAMEPVGATLVTADPDYFGTAGLRLRDGRDFTRTDSAGSPRVTVIGEHVAARLWPDGRAVGRTVMVGRLAVQPPADTVYMPHVVVGVVAEPSRSSRSLGSVYIPRLQLSPTADPRVRRDVSLVVRTGGPAAGYAAAIVQEIHALDPDVPVLDAASAWQRYYESNREGIAMTNGITLAGGITLFMACVGVYAVIAFGINQRTREIGIRMALGARRSQVVALFFRDGLRLALIGFVIGIPLSLLAMKLSLGSGSGEILTPGPIATVVGVLLVVTAVASWLPARRAAGVNPMEAARSE
jgi:predicted permease